MENIHTSKVLIAQSYGPSDVLEYHDITLNPLAEGFARIRVKAAGINPIDARRMTGEFKHAGLPQTFGTEFAGEILEIADNSSSFKVDVDGLGRQPLGGKGCNQREAVRCQGPHRHQRVHIRATTQQNRNSFGIELSARK